MNSNYFVIVWPLFFIAGHMETVWRDHQKEANGQDNDSNARGESNDVTKCDTITQSQTLTSFLSYLWIQYIWRKKTLDQPRKLIFWKVRPLFIALLLIKLIFLQEETLEHFWLWNVDVFK